MHLAALSAQALLRSVIWVLIIALICWLLWWLIDFIGIPEPFRKVARVIVAVAGVVLLINTLLGLVGSAFITF